MAMALRQPFDPPLCLRWGPAASTAGEQVERVGPDPSPQRLDVQPGQPRALTQIGIPHSGNQRSSSCSMGSSLAIWAFQRSSLSVSRC